MLSILRTVIAAWTSPPNATTTPSPAAAGARASTIASSRLAGPSAPGALPGRFAPVITIGASPPYISPHTTATSSIVSVPVVSTTPSPLSAAAQARRARSSASDRLR